MFFFLLFFVEWTVVKCHLCKPTQLQKFDELYLDKPCTGWNDKIVTLEKMTWFHFCLMKTGFLLLYELASCVQIPKERWEPSIMSESDTMFNEQDQRYAAVQLMLSTDPTYDNRTIASNLKMQIWIATNNRDVPRVMKTKFPAMVVVFGVVSSEGHIMPPHIFEVGLKVNTKVYLDVLKSVVNPWCNQVAGGRPRVWQQDLAPANQSKETQAWLHKECYDFVPFSHCPPPLPTWTHWTTSFSHTSRTSPT